MWLRSKAKLFRESFLFKKLCAWASCTKSKSRLKPCLIFAYKVWSRSLTSLFDWGHLFGWGQFNENNRPQNRSYSMSRRKITPGLPPDHPSKKWRVKKSKVKNIKITGNDFLGQRAKHDDFEISWSKNIIWDTSFQEMMFETDDCIKTYWKQLMIYQYYHTFYQSSNCTIIFGWLLGLKEKTFKLNVS